MRHGLPHLDRADRNFCMIARWGHLGPNIGEFISLVTLMSVAPRILSSISSSWSQPMIRWGHLGPNIGEFISLVTLMSVAPRILSSISSSWSQPMMSAHAKQYL